MLRVNKGQNQLSQIAVTLKDEDECNWRSYHRQVQWNDGLTTVFDEIEASVSVGQTVGIQVVEENAADSTRDATVLDLEVVVTPDIQWCTEFSRTFWTISKKFGQRKCGSSAH